MDDFSTNRHLRHHPELAFPDPNFVLRAGDQSFEVHKGVLIRHSQPLAQAAAALVDPPLNSAGLPILDLDDSPKDLLYFLEALYDGVSDVHYDCQDFDRASALLRLATKYKVEHIRRDILRGMTTIWPKTLQAWDLREADATDQNGVYKPRAVYPHPMSVLPWPVAFESKQLTSLSLVINLAREVDAPDILPAAFYDLGRLPPSDISRGYVSESSELHALSEEDLTSTLKGREHGSRFLSTFIVNELEGRDASINCLNRSDQDPFRKRICQATYEATTYEVLRDVNGETFQKNCDPLYAIMDSDVLPTVRRDQTSGTRLSHLHRACEPCRLEYTAAVDNARDDFWHKLPLWFSVDVSNWP